MTHRFSFVVAVLSLAMLQACGGGGSDSSNTPHVDSPAPGTTAAPTPIAAFNRGATARYQITSLGSQSFGVLSNSTQGADGAMTVLNTTVLSGSTSVKEIGGDANHAMGRWAAGTVTTASGATTLTGTDNRSYHYIAFNAPTVFPTSGTLSCDAGAFTAPTYTGGGTVGSASNTGTATGSASLSFGATGATVGGSISVAANGSNGSALLTGSIAAPNNSSTTGAYFSNGSGVYTQIGNAGAGAYLVASSFAVVLANGSRYIGVARFRCS